MSFQLYRQTTLGDALCDVLEEMVAEEVINHEVATAVLTQFDASILEALHKHVNGRATIKADLKTYKYFDNVWQFTLRNVEFRLNPTGQGSMQNAHELKCGEAKVVSIDAKLAETTAPAAQQ